MLLLTAPSLEQVPTIQCTSSKLVFRSEILLTAFPNRRFLLISSCPTTKYQTCLFCVEEGWWVIFDLVTPSPLQVLFHLFRNLSHGLGSFQFFCGQNSSFISLLLLTSMYNRHDLQDALLVVRTKSVRPPSSDRASLNYGQGSVVLFLLFSCFSSFSILTLFLDIHAFLFSCILVLWYLSDNSYLWDASALLNAAIILDQG